MPSHVHVGRQNHTTKSRLDSAVPRSASSRESGQREKCSKDKFSVGRLPLARLCVPAQVRVCSQGGSIYLWHWYCTMGRGVNWLIILGLRLTCVFFFFSPYTALHVNSLCYYVTTDFIVPVSYVRKLRYSTKIACGAGVPWLVWMF